MSTRRGRAYRRPPAEIRRILDEEAISQGLDMENTYSPVPNLPRSERERMQNLAWALEVLEQEVAEASIQRRNQTVTLPPRNRRQTYLA